MTRPTSFPLTWIPPPLPQGLEKRTKRWKNRKQRRELDKETAAGGGGGVSSGKRGSPGPAGNREDESGGARTKWQETTDRWKELKVRESERQEPVHGWRVRMRVSVREDMHGAIPMRFAWVCMLTSIYASVYCAYKRLHSCAPILQKRSSTEVMTKGQRKAFNQRMDKLKGAQAPPAVSTSSPPKPSKQSGERKQK